MCQKERQAAFGWKGIPASGKFVPSCKPDGEYDVAQCYPSVGVCWCVDKRGIEKQGTRTSSVPSCGMMGKYTHFSLFTVHKFEFSQSEAASPVLTSCDIKSLTQHRYDIMLTWPNLCTVDI